MVIFLLRRDLPIIDRIFFFFGWIGQEKDDPALWVPCLTLSVPVSKEARWAHCPNQILHFPMEYHKESFDIIYLSYSPRPEKAIQVNSECRQNIPIMFYCTFSSAISAFIYLARYTKKLSVIASCSLMPLPYLRYLAMLTIVCVFNYNSHLKIYITYKYSGIIPNY